METTGISSGMEMTGSIVWDRDDREYQVALRWQGISGGMEMTGISGGMEMTGSII